MKSFMLSQNAYHEFHQSGSRNVGDDRYITQRQYTICAGIKSIRDNTIFTRISHVPALIEQLQKNIR